MAVIYEKHYPHPTLEEEMKVLEEYMKEHESDPGYEPSPKPSFKELCQSITENTTLILIPEKARRADNFIKLAIETSEIYELDTKISREKSHIAVNYSFDSTGDMALLIPVFRQADSISFFTGVHGFDITVSLDYYTHAVFHKGRLVHPQFVEELK